MDWSKALDPANGGPGESPGYQETVQRIRERGPRQKKKKKPSKKTRPRRK